MECKLHADSQLDILSPLGPNEGWLTYEMQGRDADPFAGSLAFIEVVGT